MIHKNLVIQREQKKPILWDAFYKDNANKKPLVIFCHGYKGFKDWGSWDLVAQAFSAAELFFIKFNFSHNGGTIDNPIDFPDLEAFAENNYTKELEDVESVLQHILSKNNAFLNQIDTNNITLIGHSRGGGISILKTSEDIRIKKLITWASVSGFAKRTATIGDLGQWKKDGVKYVLNGRTKQQMPHNYQFYLDYKANETRLNIELAAKRIKIPFLIIHAVEDPSVPFNEAKNLNLWNSESELFKIENSNHVFNSSHPWTESKMPISLKKIVDKSISFIKKN
ncbi:alpha/beta hydrolase fold domain-containing protein [Oceanihabitans sp. 2_MG-2023]|uniref:alpha/beta hydrolase family protein n=1 Tax=Oceanihabitans sp. 2_MG-2023 TaxID=3062661 RepID=UPI0026E47A51|nr:alpha/beta hydrolase fold domain-containing protein [Oceanihabitans sp. 2_MG-2023]MDO6595770.1 alpha/beta hydrolase fold domain-containing protein [Oceanihabitans sp. 2_MG-2023]